MSKYSQLPRNTIALLTMRAQKGVAVQDYVDWAVGALADGFDSRSLAILASLDYGIAAQTEAPEYFLKAVKELALPIPDCELAIGNWKQTESIYRKLGLSLPDVLTLLGQHLAELAEQIKEGVIDPVLGLDRIYYEIVYVYMYGSQETDGIGKSARSGFKGWNQTGIWEWDELRDYIRYDDYDGRFIKLASEQINQEIRAFADEWLEDKNAKFVPKYAIREKLPESEWQKFLPVTPIEPMPAPAVVKQAAQVIPVPIQAKVPPVIVKQENPILSAYKPIQPEIRRQPGTTSNFESANPIDSCIGHFVRMLVMLGLGALLFAGLLKIKDIPLVILVFLWVLGLAVIMTIADRTAKSLGFFGKKPSEVQQISKIRRDNPQITATMSDDDMVILLQQADQTLASGKPMAFLSPRPSDTQASHESKSFGVKNGSSLEIANEYMRTGLIYEQQGHYDLAIEELNKSLEFYSRLGDQHNKALNYCNLGIAYEGLNNYPLAIEMYQKGMDIMAQIGNAQGMTIIHSDFANTFKKMGDFEQAQNHYLQALKISEQIGDLPGEALNNFNLGQLYREQGEIPQAYTHLRRAQELFDLAGDKEKADFTSRVLLSM